MTHLLYKDLYMTRKTILIYLLLGLILQFNPVITTLFIFFIGYGIIAKSELTEDKYGGYTFLSTLPISKNSIVMSKFVLGLLITSLATAFTLILQLLINNLSIVNISTILATAAISLITIGFLLLLSYKYGAVRAITYFRILVLSFFLIPWLLQMLPLNLFSAEKLIQISLIWENSGPLLLIFSLLTYVVLMLISINIFKKRMS